MNCAMTAADQERLAFINGQETWPFAVLADAEDSQTHVCDAEGYVSDAKASFPDEDFLQELITDLRALSKSRVTKADVLEFVGRLEALQIEVSSATEYGMEQLQKAESSLNAISV